MTNKQYFKILIAVFALVLIFSGASLAQTKISKSNSAASKKFDCSKATDSQIAREINNQIRKIKARNYGKTSNIRVAVKNKVITLRGRILNQRAYREITNYVKNLKCGRSFNNLLNTGCNIGDCNKPNKMCGGICILCTDTCN